MARRWHAKCWKPEKETKSWHGAMAGYVDPSEFAVSILSDGDYASLFVYMFRRFGIPESGSDPYKDIACWYLTTPDPAVALIVNPRPCGIRHSFGYFIDTKIYDEWVREDEQREKVETALRESIKDLLIPTNVRDVYINAVGKVKDDDIGKVTCDYFKWAGYGVTADYYKKFETKG